MNTHLIKSVYRTVLGIFALALVAGFSSATAQAKLRIAQADSLNHARAIAVTTDEQIYHFDGSSWIHIPGRLVHVSYGTDGSMWGVNSSNQVYRRQSADSNKWNRMASISLVQVDALDYNQAVGVDRYDRIYHFNGTSWDRIQGWLDHASYGADGSIWGVSSRGVIFRRASPTSGDWERVRKIPELKQVDALNFNRAIGVNTNDSIIHFNNTNWKQIDGALVNASYGTDGSLWGVNASRQSFRRTAVNNDSWRRINQATLEAPPPPPEPPTTPPPSKSGYVAVDDETAVFRGPTVPTRTTFEGNFPHPNYLIKCTSTHFEQVDPIVSPGQRSHHLHEFFGNPTTNRNTTTQSLADTPSDQIQCTDKNDRSSYWNPAVFQDGRRIKASKMSVYYRIHASGITNPIPLGLRMIAGNTHHNGQGDRKSKTAFWQGDGGTKTADTGKLPTPRRDRNDELILRVLYPSCWDGVNLDSPDHRSHMAYPSNDRCPSTHPVPLARVATWTLYPGVKGGKGFTLSSGHWSTAHQDFWNAWHPEQMQEMIDTCIGTTVPGAHCSPGGGLPMILQGGG